MSSRGLTHTMVDGFPGGACKKYDSIEEARAAFVNGPPWEDTWVIPEPMEPIATSPADECITPSKAAIVDNAPSTPQKPSRAHGRTGSSSYACASTQTRQKAAVPSSAPLPTPQSQLRVPPRAGTSSALPVQSPSVTSTSLSTSHTPRTSTTSIATTSTSTIVVDEGRSYVVVRGDHPGVYVDKYVRLICADYLC